MKMFGTYSRKSNKFINKVLFFTAVVCLKTCGTEKLNLMGLGLWPFILLESAKWN